jgi:DNA-binding NarL/FixJ family response regulator
VIQQPRSLSVLLVDDQSDVRFMVRLLLESEGGLEVIGEAKTGAEAIDLANSLHPDVIVMDEHMPEMSGGAATREILSVHPETLVIAFTSVGDGPGVDELMGAGASLHVRKDHPEELIEALLAERKESQAARPTL